MKLSSMKLGQKTQVKAVDYAGAEKEMVDFLTNLAKDIDNAIKETHKKQADVSSSYPVQNAIGKMVRVEREEWYRTLFK